MANRNGLGPSNQGPRTGRGLGDCPVTGAPDGNTNIPRSIPRGIGRGQGLGRGRGIGRGLPRQPVNPNK